MFNEKKLLPHEWDTPDEEDPFDDAQCVHCRCTKIDHNLRIREEECPVRLRDALDKAQSTLNEVINVIPFKYCLTYAGDIPQYIQANFSAADFEIAKLKEQVVKLEKEIESRQETEDSLTEWIIDLVVGSGEAESKYGSCSCGAPLKPSPVSPRTWLVCSYNPGKCHAVPRPKEN